MHTALRLGHQLKWLGHRVSLLAFIATIPSCSAWRWDAVGPSGAADPGMRYAHSLTGWKSTTTQAIMCGGYAADSGALTSGCVLLDPNNGWRFKKLVDPADAAPRAEHTAAFFGDFLLLYGGNTSYATPQVPEVFKLGVWTPVPGVVYSGDAPPPRRGHASTLVSVPQLSVTGTNGAPLGAGAPTTAWVSFGGQGSNASSQPLSPLGDVAVLDLGDGVTPAFTWRTPAVVSEAPDGPLPAPRYMHSLVLRPPPTVRADPRHTGSRRLRTGPSEASTASATADATAPRLGSVAPGQMIVHGGIDAAGNVLSDVWLLSLEWRASQTRASGDAGSETDPVLTAVWTRQDTSGASPSFGHRAAVISNNWYVVVGGQSSLAPGSPASPPFLRALILSEWRWVTPAAVGSGPSLSLPLLAPALWTVGTTDERDGFDDGTPGYEQSVVVHGGARAPAVSGTAAFSPGQSLGDRILSPSAGVSIAPSTLFLLSEVGIEDLAPEVELALLIAGGLAAAGALLGFTWCAYRHKKTRRSVASLASAGLATGLQRYYPSAQGMMASGGEFSRLNATSSSSSASGGRDDSGPYGSRSPMLYSGAPVQEPSRVQHARLSPLTAKRTASAIGALAAEGGGEQGRRGKGKGGGSSGKKKARDGSKRALLAGQQDAGAHGGIADPVSDAESLPGAFRRPSQADLNAAFSAGAASGGEIEDGDEDGDERQVGMRDS